MATLSFRPITVSFTPSARREMHAFDADVPHAYRALGAQEVVAHLVLAYGPRD